MTPKNVNKEEKRKQIYEAAISLFSQKGVWNTTISQIAKKAGVGKGTIYEYFRSKEDILMAALEFVITRVFELFQEEFDMHDGVIDRLMAYPRALSRYFEEESPESAFLIFIFQMEAFFFSDEKFKSLRGNIVELKTRVGLPIMNGVFETIDEGKEKGLIREDISNVDILFIVIYQSLGQVIHGLGNSPSSEKLNKTFRDVLLNGIKPQNGGIK
ncbi:MAG: TetR/AcrR family transcriptional regulator [Candidatus Zixiibacteriota bacterium]